MCACDIASADSASACRAGPSVYRARSSLHQGDFLAKKGLAACCALLTSKVAVKAQLYILCVAAMLQWKMRGFCACWLTYGSAVETYVL
jgi:hypothetical protein